MGYLDRIEIEFTSDVPIVARDAIHQAITLTINGGDLPLWYYEMTNTNNGAHRIEITAHDRTVFDLTDGQVVERLRETAKVQGISVKELLRRLATDSDHDMMIAGDTVD